MCVCVGMMWGSLTWILYFAHAYLNMLTTALACRQALITQYEIFLSILNANEYSSHEFGVEYSQYANYRVSGHIYCTFYTANTMGKCRPNSASLSPMILLDFSKLKKSIFGRVLSLWHLLDRRVQRSCTAKKIGYN